MTDSQTVPPSKLGNTEKDPHDWVTGDEAMTGAQHSYLKTLSAEAKVPFEEGLSKAQASERIEELQKITGRGEPTSFSEQSEDPRTVTADEAAKKDSTGG